MEPISTLLVIGGLHLARELKGRSHTAPAPAPSASIVKCRWCGKAISGHVKTTTCCHQQMCATCVPQWAQAGGMNCVFCNTVPPC